MTNTEILKASLLDIVFENRNKDYGAYALRNDYDSRLLKALGIGLGTVLLFILLNYLQFSTSAASGTNQDKDEMKLTNVDMEEDQPKEPEKIKEPEQPMAGQVDYQKIVIVPNNEVERSLPTIDDLAAGIVSNINTGGTPTTTPDPIDNLPAKTGTDNGEPNKAVPVPEIKIYHRDPQFPGGMEALIEFMKKNLVTPGDLEVGEKKVVRVRFIVGIDGSITDVTVLETPGRDYDKEVSRVVRKMPKWEPAIQNDIRVPVGYVLPVTFIAVEE